VRSWGRHWYRRLIRDDVKRCGHGVCSNSLFYLIGCAEQMGQEVNSRQFKVKPPKEKEKDNAETQSTRRRRGEE
jgi:hypothetical protein